MATIHLGTSISLKFISTSEEDGQKIYFQFIICFLMFFGESLSIILYLFQKHQIKKSENSIRDISFSDEKYVIIPQKSISNKKIILKMCLMVFLISTLDCCATLSLLVLKSVEFSFYEFTLKMFLIIFTMALSHIFLKMKYYRHHFFGVSLVCIVVVINIIIELINLKKEDLDNSVSTLVSILMFIGFQIASAIVECSEKYLMHVHFLNLILY
jgi:hypothetical protein